MKKEKSVLHLCEGTLLALVILLIMDLYLLKFLQDPEVSYYPMLHLMEAALALLVVTLALSLIQRELLSLFTHHLLYGLRHSWIHGCKIKLFHDASFHRELATLPV